MKWFFDVIGIELIILLISLIVDSGGVRVCGGTFTKTDGIIIGYASNMANNNVIKNNSGTVQSDRSHALYVASDSAKCRETTAEPSVNMDSTISGVAGRWEN